MFKSMVTYNAKKLNTIHRLNQEVDDLRITAMAHLEHLLELMNINTELAEREGWSVKTIKDELQTVLETLNTKI